MSNTAEHPLEEAPSGGQPAPEWEGSWERKKRNPSAAAILGLIIVGVIYFYGQGIIAAIAVLIAGTGGHEAAKGETILKIMMDAMTAVKGPIRIALIVSQFGFMLLPTVWLVRRWHTRAFLSYVRFRPVPVTEILMAIGATLLFMPASSFLSNFLLRELHFPDFLARINEQVFTSYSGSELVWLIVVVCVTPAICEETLFRGYVQRTLERNLGLKSVFVAGTIFGLYHMEPINLISLALLGMMIGFFFYRSKSLLPGMAAHFTNNFVAILSVYRHPDGRLALGFLEFDPTWPVVLVTLALTFGLLYLYSRGTRRNFGVIPPLPVQPGSV